MKRKTVFAVLLTLLFCFSLVITVNAAQPTAKDLVVAAIKNFDLGVNKGFYEKSRDESRLTVTKFDGSVKEEVGDFTGSYIDLLTQLDNPNNTIKMGYSANIKGNTHKGDFYLADDKVILSKDIFYLLQEFGIDVWEDNSVSLDQLPSYLYLSNEQLKSVWEQMADYQNQQMPQEYQDMLVFLVEAVPDEYFSISSNKVIIKLDQVGFEDTIFNLLTKIKSEPEKFADIIVNANEYNFEQMDISPADMKQEIISGIEKTTFPGREEIKLISSFVEVADFTYEKSILPGGPQKFNMNLNIKVPDDSVNGYFNIAVDTAGNQENKEGAYQIAGGFNAVDGPEIDFMFDGTYNYQDTIAYSDATINVTAKDNTTEKLMLDLGLSIDSVSKVDGSMVLTAPVMTTDNSMDITALMPSPEQSIRVSEPGKLNLVINENYIDATVKPYVGEQGEVMVPARAVFEELGYEVKWINSNQLHIVGEDKVISMSINEKIYTVDGMEKTLDIPSYLEDGKCTMVPLSLITNELAVKRVDLSGENLLIDK